MNKEDISRIMPGLYKVFWVAGGFSYAAIGYRNNGKFWIMPINWTKFPNEKNTKHIFEKMISSITFIETNFDEEVIKLWKKYK